MKVVIKFGGSVLCPDGKPDTKLLKKLSDNVRKFLKGKNEVHFVAGGGVLGKNYVAACKEFGLSNTTLDLIGVKSSRLNAMSVIAAFHDIAYPFPPERFEDIGKALASGKMLVMGGLTPGQTTDAVAVQLADYIGADLLIKGTSVDGIYDSDPRKNKKAKKFDEISYEKLFEIVSNDTFVAGTSSIIDPQAALLLKRSNIRTIALDIRNVDNLINALKGKKFVGTEITD
ncbi:MAG: UMP kinase [Candidatus Aenigmarchaeota archaeon]|nr:UMP kinase [Candidatus Aenigmarchaeota archaeon]